MKVMIDSGAHSLFVKYKAQLNFYESDEFWEYVDTYAEFIKANQDHIAVYVNVDIIRNAELTWKVQKYLEDTHKLNPLPVFHTGEDFKWLKKYIDNYDYIGLGGLGQKGGKTRWMKTIGDPAFSLICPSPDYIPIRKFHGFAMTSPDLISDYPWYSVDSSSWVSAGKYGMVIIPPFKNGKYDYTISPYFLNISTMPNRRKELDHIDHRPLFHQKEFYKYFADKGFIFGKSEIKDVDEGYVLKDNEKWLDRKTKTKVEIIVERGLCNDHRLRDQINLQYYLDLEAQAPSWPSPWRKKDKIKTRRLF